MDQNATLLFARASVLVLVSRNDISHRRPASGAARNLLLHT